MGIALGAWGARSLNETGEICFLVFRGMDGSYLLRF